MSDDFSPRFGDEGNWHGPLATAVLMLVAIAIIAIGSCSHYQFNVLPLKMAEKGYCWKRVQDSQSTFAYQPCTVPPQ